VVELDFSDDDEELDDSEPLDEVDVDDPLDELELLAASRLSVR